MKLNRSIFIRTELYYSIILAFLLIFACKDKSRDPQPSVNSPNYPKGSIADTCLSGFGGTAIVRFSATDTSKFDIVFSQCEINPEGEYLVAGSQDTSAGISFYFKGMPLSGNFRLQDIFSFRASIQVDQLYILYSKGDSFYASKSEGALILITNKDNKLSFKLPRLTYNRIQGEGANTVSFSVEVEHTLQ